MNILRRTLIICMAASCINFAVHAESNNRSASFSSLVDAGGEIKLPRDFKLSLQHIGSWYVPDGGASGFHDVYTEASSIRHFQEHGQFPDGATLIKELRASVAGDYSTGAGVHRSTEEIKQWFVMVKDEKGRFPDNPSWGKGWGWALIKPETGSVNVSKNYQADCMGCHIPVQDSDWVFLEGYPILNTKN